MRATPIPTIARLKIRVRSNGRCERCGVPTTQGQAHHRRSRSIRDEHTHHPCNLVYLCGECHRWVHAHPMLARSTGFIVTRQAPEPGVHPVTTPWGLRIHLCGGTYEGMEQT